MSEMRSLTGKDCHLILRYYDVMSVSMLAARLNVSKEDVADFGRKHHCSFATNPAWFQDEISYLIKFHKTKTPSEMADRIGRSRLAVEIKMKEMDLPRLKVHCEWTKAEDKYIEEHINNQSLEKTAEMLHRPKDSVLTRAKKLGISTLDSIIPIRELKRRWGVDKHVIDACTEAGLPVENLVVFGKKYRVVETFKLDEWCANHVEMLSGYGVAVAAPESYHMEE